MIRIIGVCWLISTLMSASASAVTLTTYSNRALFEAALSTQTLIDFENIVAPNSSQSYSNAAGLTLSGVNFVGWDGVSDYFLYVEQSSAYNWGTGAVLRAPPAQLPYRLNVTLPASNGVGFNLMSYTPGATLVITLPASLGGGTYSVATNPTQGLNPTWWGIVSDTPFTSIQISILNSGRSPLIDNFEYGTTGEETPEVQTILMIGAGLLIMAYGRRFYGGRLA